MMFRSSHIEVIQKPVAVHMYMYMYMLVWPLLWMWVEYMHGVCSYHKSCTCTCMYIAQVMYIVVLFAFTSLRWKRFEISIRKLCSGDWDRTIKITVWDWNKLVGFQLTFTYVVSVYIPSQYQYTYLLNSDTVSCTCDPLCAHVTVHVYMHVMHVCVHLLSHLALVYTCTCI